MIFYYIRHGDPIYDPDSLTPLGQRQAEAVAKRLAAHGIDEIYASTSQRAIETAQPTCEILKKEMTLLDFANEDHAWRELAVVDNGRRGWLFHNPKFIKLFAENIKGETKIKAAGGIASFDDAEGFIKLGASRLGTSRLVKILKNESVTKGY